jgi:hypothetical protein
VASRIHAPLISAPALFILTIHYSLTCIYTQHKSYRVRQLNHGSNSFLVFAAVLILHHTIDTPNYAHKITRQINSLLSYTHRAGLRICLFCCWIGEWLMGGDVLIGSCVLIASKILHYAKASVQDDNLCCHGEAPESMANGSKILCIQTPPSILREPQDDSRRVTIPIAIKILHFAKPTFRMTSPVDWKY